MDQATPINEYFLDVSRSAGFNIGPQEWSKLRSQRNRSSGWTALNLYHLQVCRALRQGREAVHQRENKADAFMDEHSIGSMDLQD